MDGDFIGVAMTCLAYGIVLRDSKFIGLGIALLAHRVTVLILRSYGL